MAKKKSSIHLASIFFLLGVAAIVAISLLLVQQKYLDQIIRRDISEQDYVLEQEQNEMHEIPQDVSDAISKATSSGQPVLGIRADGPSYHIPILLYHYVEHVKDKGDTTRISLNIIPEILDQQIKTLKDDGYDFITASDVADILDGIKPMPQKPVVLSFDDGYRDFYTDVFPILKKYNVKAVSYVISGFLDKPNNLTTQQLEEISKSGLVEIGAHTQTHPSLPGVSAQRAKEEIEGSKIKLEALTGKPVVTFAYPYGSFNLSVMQETRQAGYRLAVSTLNGEEVNSAVRFLVHRVRPGVNTGQKLLYLLKNTN